jgi:hypothetical protein
LFVGGTRWKQEGSRSPRYILKSNSGYIGFIEELPGVNSHGRTIDEAARHAAEARRGGVRRGAPRRRGLIEGKDVVRESFFIPIPRAPDFQRSRDRKKGRLRSALLFSER